MQKRLGLIMVVSLIAGCGPDLGRGHGDQSGGNGGSAGGGGDTGGGAGSPGGGGGGGSTGGPTFAGMCHGTATTLSGVITAPNGKDPVANALAYVPASNASPAPGVACELCNMPIGGALTYAVTDAQGHFTLDLGTLPVAPSLQLTVSIGRFRRTTAVAVTPCQSTAASTQATTLPGKTGPGDEIPKMAVATGNVDQLDLVLVGMGIDASVGFDCFEGRYAAPGHPLKQLSSPCGARTTTPIETLLKDLPTLKSYNMLFLSCATHKFANLSAGDQQTIVANLKAWAQAGGRLFVTDASYDYVAQSFPNDVTFLNGNGTVDAANVGVGAKSPGTSYTGKINDATLASWLTTVGALPAGTTTVTLSGYLDPWSALQSVPATTQDIIDATDAKIYMGTTPGAPMSLPQTIKFDVTPPGGTACGRVIYSSYHTTSGSMTTSFGTQEHILEYLMLEASACVGTIG